MVVAVEGVVPRGQQPQVAPAAFLCVGAEPIGACLRDHDEVGPLGEVKSSTLKPVDDRCARRARLLDKRQLGCLAPWGTRSWVFRPAREHHVVDDQRVLARCEQLREPHLAATGRGLEDVVLPDEAARWECPALGGDLLVQPPELCLRLQQLVACASVFARLAGEVDIRVEEYFPPLVHVAWFALESHCFHPFLCSELSPCGVGNSERRFMYYHFFCGATHSAVEHREEGVETFGQERVREDCVRNGGVSELAQHGAR